MNPIRAIGTAMLGAGLAGSLAGQVNVLTNRYDNGRTGANLAETVLTAANVNPAHFGKLWTYAVDGSVFAQPLYVQGQVFPGKGPRNALYVATMNDSVYAFDADSSQTLWSVHLTNPAGGVTAIPTADVAGTSQGIVGTMGIEGTPVIDLPSRTMYFIARTKEPGPVWIQRLHALDLITGAEKFGGPVAITASVPAGAGTLAFDYKAANQRAALALTNGMVIVCWASHADIEPYHGWVMAYDAATLKQVGVFTTTPTGLAGAVWQSGGGPSIDADGNVYVITGNGDWDGMVNFGDSFLKLAGKNGLPLLDWFTPDNQATLNVMDLDLGATSAMLIPGTKLMLGGGKSGAFYLINTGALGHMQTGNGQIVQWWTDSPAGQNRCTPVYWNSPGHGGLIYEWPMNDVLKVYHFNGVTVDAAAPFAEGTVVAQNPGAMLVVSANGAASGTGVLWASMPLSASAGSGVVAGILRAFDASNPTVELWNSTQNAARDGIASFCKFNPLTVANGRVYAGTFSAQVSVYGLLAAPPVFTALPAAQTVAAGATATLSAAAAGSPAPSYQWRFNGANLPGATSPTLVISGAAAANAGSYDCVATNVNGSATSPSAHLAVTTTADPGRLINLSALGQVASAGSGLTVGFVTGGAGTRGVQPLLIRGIGPALGAFNVSGALADPVLTVYRGSGVVAANDNWGGAAAVTAADTAASAFALPDPASLDAALVTALPSGAAYSAAVTGNHGTAGMALAELYDATPAGTYTGLAPRLTNLSCLGSTAPGAPLAAGFTIGGSTARAVLIRVSGPSLAGFGVAGGVPDPQLTLHSAAGGQDRVIAFNGGWGGDPLIAATAASVHAFPFASATSADAAQVITLAPGPYSVQVSSASGAAGAALVEIYELP